MSNTMPIKLNFLSSSDFTSKVKLQHPRKEKKWPQFLSAVGDQVSNQWKFKKAQYYIDLERALVSAALLKLDE